MRLSWVSLRQCAEEQEKRKGRCRNVIVRLRDAAMVAREQTAGLHDESCLELRPESSSGMVQHGVRNGMTCKIDSPAQTETSVLCSDWISDRE